MSPNINDKLRPFSDLMLSGMAKVLLQLPKVYFCGSLAYSTVTNYRKQTG